ncbi:MAG: ribose-phosphate pyrophosphokinase [Anaerocolumna sp.]
MNSNFKKKLPVAPLKILSLESFMPMAEKIDQLIVSMRHEEASETKDPLMLRGYNADSFLVQAKCPRFSSGEAKGLIQESIHGTDLYILADITNYSQTYHLYKCENQMSPDDHFQDLIRMIDACNGKAHRINVILPFLYESRQDKRTNLESLDCATALQELVHMGVKNIITFDAHDPRVQNAIPIEGFDNFYTSFQFIQALLGVEKNLNLSAGGLMIISPDEGGMSRAVFYANILGLDMGMFYKRRDYTTIQDGKNPIVAHEFLGGDVEGRDVFIIDDMISSGESVIDVAQELKLRKANKVFVAASFGLFTHGLSKFDEAYENGIIDRVFTTNLIYCPKELLSKPYYTNVDVSKYLALIIHTINHDNSVDAIVNATYRIKDIVKQYKEDRELRNANNQVLE